MRRFIIRRLGWTLFIMWAVTTILFFGMRSLPGGPVEAILGAQATDAAVESLRTEMGLNRPLVVQYADFLTDVAVLDFGTSFVTNENINSMLLRAVPKTASIAVVALLIGPLIAVPAGVVSATRRGTAT
jgi:peptide/nickel transport system permease protein